MKYCPDCKLEKEVIHFGKETAKKDGLRSICKPCNSLRALEWHNKNVDHVNARERAVHKKDPSKNNTKNRKWRINNPQKQKAISKRSYENRDIEKTRERSNKRARNYREENRARSKIDYKKNKEKLKPTRQKWERENSDKRAAIVGKRRAIKLLATPSWLTEEDYVKIRSFYALARKLTKETDMKHEVDHILPLQGETVSGFHHWNNLQVLTRRQNRIKANRIDSDIVGLFPDGFEPKPLF